MEQNKTQGQELSEKLSYKVPNLWEKWDEDMHKNSFEFSEEYKVFLDKGKTEREAASYSEKAAIAAGFKDINELLKSGAKLKSGDKVYQVFKGKTIILGVVGKKSLQEGVNLLGAHIDAPRIDLKQNPLYEDSEMVLLKTHYYGGIKKYQWVTIPLALHGVVIKKDGTSVEINIGEDENDPVFTITDLLPHLAQDQMQKKMIEGITGEALNLLFGSIPYKDDKVKDKVKLNILKLLNEKYGMIEEDFISSELEIVPAFKARDIGLDRGMVGAYGQDDRVCSFGALKAIIDVKDINKTSICVLSDKEEIGSVGNTGAESTLLENFIAYMIELTENTYNENMLRRCLQSSKMMSADVNPGVDPNYEGVQDKRNASYMGKGLVIEKYTGSRGKSGGSDANAEFIGELRKLFNENGIVFQSAELGKVDQGGGGTIARYIANLGVDVIDCGVAILSMHAPYEITSKVDIYMNYLANKVFLEKA